MSPITARSSRTTRSTGSPSGSFPHHVETFTYDKVGNKLTESDANGNPTSYEYDRLNRVTKRTDALGNEVELVYDEAGNVTLEHDVTRGLRKETDYDALNRPLEQRVLDVPSTFTYITGFLYDDGGHAVTVTDPRGFETTTYLDGFDRTHRVEQDAGGDLLVTTSYYDANGNVRQTEDAEGRTTDLSYDGLNRLLQVDHPLTYTTQYTYDGGGNKLTETNRRDLTTTFTYDNLGRPLTTSFDSSITGVATATSITYNDALRQRVETDARGKATTYEMDAQGRVVKVTDPATEEQTFEYDAVNKTAEVDKLGNRTEFEYDDLNRVITVRDALLQEITTVYNDAARTVVETDRKNYVKTTQLDALGRLVSVTRSSVLLEQHEYDGNGSRTLSTDANGNQTQFEYDGANRLIARTDGYGGGLATRTTFKYDAVGNLLEEKDGRSTGRPFDVKNVYDDLNRLTSVEDAEGNVTTFEYDGEGNKTAQVEPKGAAYRTEYDYGELNELIEVRMADGGVYEYAYDANRNRVSQTDAEDNVVTFSYDDLNRVDLMTQEIPGESDYVTDHDYDANGNETKLTDPKGQVVDFEYDELNRLEKKIYNLTAGDYALYTRTHEITFHYDANDNLEQIDELKSTGTDPPALVYSYKTYDTLDRLTSETDAWGRTLTYDYDDQGNRTLLVDPDNKRTVYGFDSLNRLETLTLDEGTANEEVVSYEYFGNGLKKKVTNPNSTVSNYLYDASGRMTYIGHTGPTGVISSYNYTYDENGNRERQIETNAGRTETTDYTYDLVNRLKTVTYEVGSAAAVQVTYTYDLVGNRLTEQDVLLQTATLQKDLSYSYDAINRLDAIDDLLGTDDVTYTYDSNGNTLSRAKGGVTTSFLFDIRNQLGEMQQGVNVLGRYGYDSGGLRILKIGDEGRRQYTYDQLSVITEADQANLTVSKYDYGLDQLVRLDSNSEGRSFFHLDILGSTVSLSEATGSARQSIFYDAWGNERDRIGVSVNKFTFTGHEKDAETGLIYAKARFYDADVGRFLTQDTFLGDASNAPSLHRFAYAFSNPIVFVDPTGNEVELSDFTTTSMLARFGAFADGLANTNSTAFNFTMNFAGGLLKLPEQIGEGFANLLTPGDVEGVNTLSVTRQNQADLLKLAAEDPSVVKSLLLKGTAMASQPAVIIEEALIEPVLNFSKQSENIGIHAIEAWDADNAVDPTVHSLEAVKEFTGAFSTALGIAAPVKGVIEKSIANAASRETLAIAEQQATRAGSAGLRVRSGIRAGYGGRGSGGSFGSVRGLGPGEVPGVATDANALIMGLEKGEGAALDKALGGRAPVVSRQAVREFLVKGDKNVLREFLKTRGGRVGRAGTETLVESLRGQAESLGRKLKLGDARVAASALEEGISVITRDRSFRNFLNAIGIGGELF